jgi:hypothetical protein
MKYESTTSTDLGEPSDLHEFNGTTSANVKNGTIKETTNGVSSTFAGNGAVRNGSGFNDEFFGHSREEVTRLIIQVLSDLGYRYLLPLFLLLSLVYMLIRNSRASRTLSDESGFNTESNDVSEFRKAVLAGAWGKAESHLSNIPLHENGSLGEALFLIREQKFLESLEDKDFTSALSILRTELSPLNINTEKVHNLSR